jgi:phosphoenolpyruvate carboxykinase (diphosphate)
MTNHALSPEQLRLAINLRLGLLGCAPVANADGDDLSGVAAPLFAQQREIARRLTHQLSPVDERIQHFLNTYLAETGPAPRLPARTFVLDQPGLARELSLPADGDTVDSPLLKSFRLHNGVLHNPANDRRTTQGVFHIAEGGLPVPDDKLAVPKLTFSRMLGVALHHPPELLRLPYTATQKNPAECIVSLMLRPLVVPAVPGFIGEKRMEIRFFAPGSLVSNLDFIENIFGNAGDPYIAENDAALDVDGWTGHTGCVIRAQTPRRPAALGSRHAASAS